MTTIHVIVASKQYEAAPKLIAAFGTPEAAAKMMDTLASVEPRLTLSVMPVELSDLPLHRISIKTAPAPEPGGSWVTAPDIRYAATLTEIDAQGRSARLFEQGGPVKGELMVGDDPTEVFIPSNPDGPTAA